MSPLGRLMRRWLDRQARAEMLRWSRRYRDALGKSARVLPGDPVIARLIEEHRQAEEAIRSARG